MTADLDTIFPEIVATIWFSINKERLWQVDSLTSLQDMIDS